MIPLFPFIILIFLQISPSDSEDCYNYMGEFREQTRKILDEYKVEVDLEVAMQNLTANMQHHEDVAFYIYRTGGRVIDVTLQDLIDFNRLLLEQSDHVNWHFEAILNGLIDLKRAFLARLVEEKVAYGNALHRKLLKENDNELAKIDRLKEMIDKYGWECRNQMLTLRTEMEMFIAEHNLAQRVYTRNIMVAVNNLVKRHGSRRIDPIYMEENPNGANQKLGLLVIAEENPLLTVKMFIEKNIMKKVERRERILRNNGKMFDETGEQQRPKSNSKMVQNKARLSP